MTNARLRYNGVATGSAGSLVDLALSGSHTNSTTTLTFNAALTHSNGTAVPTLAGGDYFMLSILDAGGHVAEIVKVTAYTSGGTTATVTRGQEGTSGVAHASGAKVVSGPSVVDISGDSSWTAVTYVNGHTTLSGYPAVAYRKDGAGFVHMRGILSRVGSITGTLMFTLPTGYRPGGKVFYNLPNNSGSGVAATMCAVEIDTTGTATFASGPAAGYVGFDAVTFLAEG